MTNAARLMALSVLIASLGCQPSGPVDEVSDEPRSPASSIGSTIGQFGTPDASAAPLAVPPKFVDVASQVGIDFDFYADIVPDRFFLPEIMGGGVGWLDYDLDGRLDLYAANGAELIPTSDAPPQYADALFRQQDGRFVEVAARAGIQEFAYGQGIAVGDFDADGFPDLFVANFGENRLFRNQGDGSFADWSERAGISGATWSSSPLWLDVNSDGLLDLFVTNYMDVRSDNFRACPYGGIIGYCGPGQYAGIDDQVWINEGDGRFREAGRELGLVGPDGKGLAIVAVDLDEDLLPEIYVANDMVNNFLFTRSAQFQSSDAQSSQSEPLFHEVAQLAGAAAGETGQPEASMGIALGDFDADGLFDLHLTHYHTHKNTLYRNRGQLMFSDDSKRSGIARISLPYLGFGTAAIDFDRDRDLDLFVGNGHVLGPYYDPEEMSPQWIMNDGKGKFTDITAQAGDYFQGKYLARSVASADWDNDGDIDLAVSRIGDPLSLLDNRTESPARWLGFCLLDPERRDHVGGRLEVFQGEFRQVIPVVSGGSYLASPDPRLVVGLGSIDSQVQASDDSSVGSASSDASSRDETSGQTPTASNSGRQAADDSVQIVMHWNEGRVDRWSISQLDRYWQLSPGAAPVDLSSLPK